METVAPKEMGLEDRRALFDRSYDYENDPAVTLVEIVRAAGGFLERIVGEEQAAIGMKGMIGTFAQDGTEWRDDLDDATSGAFSEWPLGSLLHKLSAYAYYGIDLSTREHENEEVVEARLGTMIGAANGFLDVCPLEMWLGETRSPQLEDVILLARNRWALDHDRPVEPEALAIFGGVKMSRMRNMITGKTPVFHRENGLVPAHEALPWLLGRDGFYPSIWRTARPSYDGDITYTTYLEPMFVPQAKDGSIFHPGLERRNGFTIGEKGEERQVSNFEDALTELQEMPSPSWRRPPPGGKGGWGVVRGIGWARVSRDELDARARSEKELMKAGDEGDENE